MKVYTRLTPRDWHEAKVKYSTPQAQRIVLKKCWNLENAIENGELCDREESEWKHQTEVLRLALSKSVADENAIFDDDVCRYILSNTKLTEEYYIQQAEKELQEDRKYESGRNN